MKTLPTMTLCVLALTLTWVIAGCHEDDDNGGTDAAGGTGGASDGGAGGTGGTVDPGSDAGPTTPDAAILDAEPDPPPDVALPDAAPPDAAPSTAICTEAVPVPCEDQMIQEMALQDTVAQGAITNEHNDGVWRSVVDATAGGAFANPPDAFVYGRFTDEGLVKLDISDEDALESMEWDMAFRRYVVRINGGASGPSCVAAARTAPNTDFATATAPEDPSRYNLDAQYTPTCEFVPDGSGLPSSPATVLAGYYSYGGCVSMTGNVYVVRQATGRMLKLAVAGYYAPLSKQEYCQEHGEAATRPNGSGTISVDWAFLDVE